jgi:hypothetical protein
MDSSELDEVCAPRRAERVRADRRVTLGQAEALLRSACAMLREKPGDMVNTMTVSLPLDEDQTTDYLEGLTSRLASEYGLLAETAESGLHLKVRLLRSAVG